MFINPDIDYKDRNAVYLLTKQIEAAIKENGIKKTKLCEILGIHISDYSKFKSGAKWSKKEAKIRAIIEVVNKFHN